MRTIVALLISMAALQAGELHEIARMGDADRMRQALSQGPALNEPDQSGRTPLHIAVDSGQKTCIWLLLKAGADRNARDQQGHTVFDIARKIQDPADRTATLYMLRSFGSGRPQDAGLKPWSLEYSVAHRQTDLTKMLLAMGADPNTVGTGGTTPLADAALKGDLESVRALLARGARTSAVSKTGTQPIHDAALGDNPQVIQELVAQGADVNARTRDDKQTPLHIAAAMGRMKAIEALVSLGANPALKDGKGQTPLQTAERAGLTEVAASLKRAVTGK